jgi:V8-like Glu-specific endopeptidase
MSTEPEDDQSDEEIRAYWTPERRAAAKPKVWTPPTTLQPRSESLPPTGERKVIPGYDPKAIHRYDPTQSPEASEVGSPLTTSPVEDPTLFPWRTVGKLYFTAGGVEYQGSACVIYYNTLLTAAHNIYEDKIWSENYEFVPALLSDGFAPYGVWTVPNRNAFVMSEWTDSVNGDEAYDVGVLRYPRCPGKGRIGDVVGRLGLIYNQPINPPSPVWMELAYPGAADRNYNSRMMYEDIGKCSRWIEKNYIVAKAGELPEGASGGPWLLWAGVGPNTKYWVNGIRSSESNGTWASGSPYFRKSISDFIEDNLV